VTDKRGRARRGPRHRRHLRKCHRPSRLSPPQPRRLRPSPGTRRRSDAGRPSSR
jgi:hypothetical protein